MTNEKKKKKRSKKSKKSKDTKESGNEYGALIIQPKAPKRGTFSLLLPLDFMWNVTENAGTVRLNFRSRTAQEMAELWKDKGYL